MIAKSKANRCRASAILTATWFCSRPPVPESPMTRNLTEPCWFGSVDFGGAGTAGAALPALVAWPAVVDAVPAGCSCAVQAAATTHAPSSSVRSSRSRVTSVWRKDIGNVIHDDERVAVEQQHVTPVETVLQVVGETRQIHQQQRRHRRQRRIRRIRLVDGRLRRVRDLRERRALV